MVEFEIGRHDWPSRASVYGNSAVFPDAVRALRSAESRADAELALRRLEEVLPLGEGPTEVSVAAASTLVHCLWGCSVFAADLVLGVLADLAAGFAGGDLRDPVQAALRQDVLREICRGFVAYVEMAESAGSADIRTACIDLITACGGADAGLRERAIHFLEAFLAEVSFASHREVIEASLDEVRAA
ncbi:hypothetical protein [Amycolatopsis kentuckyensis]|uniref:hypothetical protein n=1 Tax=Amycolatopsis kentuckyensis TaxID=218823 RepID=UPI00356597BF